MFHLIVQLASSVRAVLQHAPTNRLLRWLHARPRVVSIVIAMLAGVAYLFAAAVCTVLLDDGGPGWLNFLVLLFIYNGFKLVLTAPALVVTRVRQRSARRRRPATSVTAPEQNRAGPVRIGPSPSGPR